MRVENQASEFPTNNETRLLSSVDSLSGVFTQGTRVYEPERQGNDEIVWHLRNNPSDQLHNLMAIRIYDSHAVLIKNIKKLASADCQALFTKVILHNLHLLQKDIDPMHINGCQLKIILYAFKLGQLASFENKTSFELSTQKRG